MSPLDDPPEVVAPRLLGALLSHAGVTLRITEVEAYAGPDDAGSHAYRGRTARNAVMFGSSGHLYCYFTYGMHVCANVVVGPAGVPGAVLLRAGEVVDGQDLARSHRPKATDRDLARGPARLCRALAIDLSLNGASVHGDAVSLTLPATPATAYATGPRVGLRAAAERPWRFWLEGERSVSSYRPAAHLGRGGTRI